MQQEAAQLRREDIGFCLGVGDEGYWDRRRSPAFEGGWESGENKEAAWSQQRGWHVHMPGSRTVLSLFEDLTGTQPVRAGDSEEVGGSHFSHVKDSGFI